MPHAPSHHAAAITVRLPSATVTAIERIAEVETRTVSNVIRIAVEAWLASRSSKARPQHEAA
jgi:predicted transcriptional regulator